METSFTAVYKKVKNWYVGYVEELPGANTQGKTLKETRENLREAIELILQANKNLMKKEMRGRKTIREKIAVEL